MPDVVADDLIQTSAIRMRHPTLRSLHRRHAREITRGALRMHILAVLVSPVETRDQRDVARVRCQRLHRLRQLHRINPRLIFGASPILFFVRREPAEKAHRHSRFVLARKKATPDEPIGHIHHHQFLRRLRSARDGTTENGRNRLQKRQRNHRPLGFQKISSRDVRLIRCSSQRRKIGHVHRFLRSTEHANISALGEEAAELVMADRHGSISRALCRFRLPFTPPRDPSPRGGSR